MAGGGDSPPLHKEAEQSKRHVSDPPHVYPSHRKQIICSLMMDFSFLGVKKAPVQTYSLLCNSFSHLCRFGATLSSTCSQMPGDFNGNCCDRGYPRPSVGASAARPASKMLRSQKGNSLGATSSVAIATEGAWYRSARSYNLESAATQRWVLAPIAADQSIPCCRNSIPRFRPSARNRSVCACEAPARKNSSSKSRCRTDSASRGGSPVF